MILKSISRRSSSRQILNYLFKKEEKLIGDNLKPIIIRHNVRSRSLEKWVKEFEKNETYRLHPRKDSVKTYHTVLSFSSKDREHINEKMLRDIAEHYIELRGKDSLFIGTPHYDKDHIHLHLVSSGTKYLTGEANRLSRAEFHELKLAMDAYQQKKYPQLINSLPRHGRSKDQKIKEKEPQIDKRNGRVSQKEKLVFDLKSAYSKSKSLEEFLTQLKSLGHEPYYRGAEKRLTGVKFEGDRKYRLKNLGYDKDKLTQLDVARSKEEKELSELRDLRESRSNDREQADELRSSRSDIDVLEDDNRYGRSREDDIDRSDRDEEVDQQDTDDRDDIK